MVLLPPVCQLEAEINKRPTEGSAHRRSLKKHSEQASMSTNAHRTNIPQQSHFFSKICLTMKTYTNTGLQSQPRNCYQKKQRAGR